MSKAERRQIIMHEAERLFTSRRFHEVTLDDVAASAHVGKGTIYRYFKDKDDLFFQVATSGFEELCSVMQARIPGEGTFTEKLNSACREIGGFFGARRQMMRMMQGEAGRMQSARGQMRKEWNARREHLLGLVANILEEGIAQGAVRSDVPANVMAGFLLGMLRTRAREMGEMPKAAKDYAVLVELFFNGARAGNGMAARSHAVEAATI
jgi:AcrR family transcriptional regulator